MYDLSNKKIWVAGHRGMVGSALVRRLQSEDCSVITATRQELDLKRQDEVEKFVQANEPDAIILAAAKVGGILANDTLPADFLYDNLIIESNIFEAAHRNDVGRLLFFRVQLHLSQICAAADIGRYPFDRFPRADQ